jgi:hypothetical protein
MQSRLSDEADNKAKEMASFTQRFRRILRSNLSQIPVPVPRRSIQHELKKQPLGTNKALGHCRNSWESG